MSAAKHISGAALEAVLAHPHVNDITSLEDRASGLKRYYNMATNEEYTADNLSPPPGYGNTGFRSGPRSQD